jgi:ribosomal protein L40E
MDKKQSSDEQITAHEELQKLDKQLCRYCASSMPVEASVCIHCGRNKRWYLNHLQIDHIGLLIALIMIILTYQQLGEVRKERIASTQALERARGAEETASTVSKNLENVQLNVNQQQLAITFIETKAKQALKEINAINDLSTQAISHAENAEQLVSKAQKSIDDLTRLMDFNLLVIKATNDDRHAFDQLRKIPYDDPFHEMALKTVFTITDDPRLSWQIRQDASMQYNFDWDKESWDFLRSMYPHPIMDAYQNRYKPNILSRIWAQKRFPIKKRIDFLYDVIKTDGSIAALNRACMLMNEEAHINKNIMGAKSYLEWYEANKSKYDVAK